jgi:hypothetical protein
VSAGDGAGVPPGAPQAASSITITTSNALMRMLILMS